MFNDRLLLEGYTSQVTSPPNTGHVEYFSRFAFEVKIPERAGGAWTERIMISLSFDNSAGFAIQGFQ